MNIRHAVLLGIGLAVASPANATGPGVTGAHSVLANRIVGTWAGQVLLGPCTPDATYAPPLTYMNVLHSGGTVTETNTMPQTGIPNLHGIPGLHTRGPAFGTWSYNHNTGKYRIKMRFYWFVDGVYNGYQSADREALLSSDGKMVAGPVRAYRHLPNGDVIRSFCGQESARRF